MEIKKNYNNNNQTQKNNFKKEKMPRQMKN